MVAPAADERREHLGRAVRGACQTCYAPAPALSMDLRLHNHLAVVSCLRQKQLTKLREGKGVRMATHVHLQGMALRSYAVWP